MKLNCLIIIRKGLENADFYLNCNGQFSEIGEPTNSYHPENIGLIIAPGFLNRDYIFYVAKQLYATGRFNPLVIKTPKGLTLEKKKLEILLSMALKGRV